MKDQPARKRTCLLPHCDGCGLLDAGSYGFAKPGAPTRHYCSDCTPSRTGSVGMPDEPSTAPSPRRDLFGRAA